MYNNSQEGEKGEEFEKTQRENDMLKKQLEEARKYISVLQQRNQADPFTFMEHFSGSDIFGANNFQSLDNDLFSYGMDQWRKEWSLLAAEEDEEREFLIWGKEKGLNFSFFQREGLCASLNKQFIHLCSQ